MKKIGVIAIALMLALGALGVGYAMWSDTITITGSVTTGSVDIEIDDVSHTYVYKVIDDIWVGDTKTYDEGDIRCAPGPLSLEQDDPAEGGNDLLLVASAVTADNTVDDNEQVTMTFTNLFPTSTCDIVADLVLHYTGSVPAKIVYTEDFTGLGALAQYQQDGWELSTNNKVTWTTVANPEDIQLHECYYLRYKKWFDLPQSPTGDPLQGITDASFTITLKAQQWNE